MSLQKKFSGTGVAIVTPFLENGMIDKEGFRKLIEHLINGKVNYLVVLGTTGESGTVHGDDKQLVFSLVNELNAGRLPLVAGIGGYDTDDVLKGFKEFDLQGYDAILSVSPYYIKPSQEGIFQHYKKLDQHTPLPIIMYNVPGRTGQNVTADTQVRIARECKNIFATKEASGDMDQIMQILKNKPKDFMVISGDDPVTLPMIACGAEGVISVVANAYPKDFSDMVQLCLDGKFAEALPLHFKYLDIIKIMFAEGNPGGVKAFLYEMGICENYFRMPVWPVSEEHMEKIRAIMKTV